MTQSPGKPQRAPETRPIRRSVTEGTASDGARKPPRDAPDDLLHLEDFNDTELLRTLWTRYERKDIYTWIGNVLISMNPYRDVGAFSEERANRYASCHPPEAPHLYATVMTALTSPGDRHALLITGESGAGKTEAARATLSFVATRQGTTDHMCERLLQSTPVLEAFGNAHTRQNTNSSRFGKFIEVHLTQDLQVVGATLQPYMLEASRVAGNLPQGERTYHVFYLLRAALTALRSTSTPQRHFLTQLSHSPEWTELAQICGAELATSARLGNGPSADSCIEWFETLHEGLVKIGMRHGEVAECCRIVAAVGLLADMEADDSSLAVAATLLHVDEGELRNFLSKAEMSVGTRRRERVQRTRSEREATTLRASFAQELYTALFGWLTRLVARGIAPASQDRQKTRALGLLDLYGFEVFSTNGFEQFLINYCNERLQQFFNRQVFTMEAEEYAAEGLDGDGQWRTLVEACQLPALDLLEGSSGNVGVFGLINDRSRCGFVDSKQDGGGTALTQAITSACGQHPAFLLAARNYSRVFGIAHFAGEVFYEADQFQNKNASAHRPDIATFLRRHGGAFVREVMNEPEQRDASPTRSEAATAAAPVPSQRKLFGRTLISVFREELNDLCSNLEACSCHHVRCLRPNDDQAPLVFDDASMLRQCRYSGLLEATRIRRQGYAYRRSLRSFASRFALLLGTRQARRVARNIPPENAALACQYICQAAAAGGISAEDASIGYTKVFLRESAFIWFEDARTNVAAGIITALLRGHQTRRRLAFRRMAATKVQAFYRGHCARMYTCSLRAERIAAHERAVAEAYAWRAREASAAAASARILSATETLQGWWRRRSARVRSMVAAVRREQEQLRRRSRTQAPWQAVDEAVPSGPSTGDSPPFSSRPGLEWMNVPHPAVTVVTEQSDPRLRAGRHGGKDATNMEDSARKNRSLSRSTRQAMDMTKRQQSGSSVTLPARAMSPARPCSVQVRVTGGARSTLASPRSIRRSYRQEIARLLAQHRQLRRRLPQEMRGLPAELMEAAHTLGHNGPPVAPEVLSRINDVLHTLKAALREPDVNGHCVGQYYTMPETRILAPSGPSAPALLQRVPSYGPNGFTFQAPAVSESFRGNLTPTRGSSLSARYLHSVTLSQSPRAAGFRSPPASARTPTRGFRSVTPVRGATVIATTISAPVPVNATPRRIVRTVQDGTPGTPVPASTIVPLWAWRPQATTATPAPCPPATTATPAPVWTEVKSASSMSACAPSINPPNLSLIPTPVRAMAKHNSSQRDAN